MIAGFYKCDSCKYGLLSIELNPITPSVFSSFHVEDVSSLAFDSDSSRSSLALLGLN